MQLYAQNMQPYEMTEEDILWFLRAVDAEGAIETEVAATLLNGFCFQRSRGQTRSFTEFVRAYAQPINPLWYVTGSKHLNEVRNYTPAERVQADEVAKKRELVHATSFEFSPVTKRAVVLALSGFVAIPKTATDYAAPHINAAVKQYEALAEAVPGMNRLWARPGATNWQGYRVEPLVVQPWLASLNNIRLESAFDREFHGELGKIAQFFRDNEAAYANREKHASLGKVALDVNEASDYSTSYTVALAQHAMNGHLASFARATQMQVPRTQLYASAKIYNAANASQWALRKANYVRNTGTASIPTVVTNALGFDFEAGAWVAGEDGQTS